MSQRALAELFAVGVPAINKHLKNIFESGELNEKGTISKMETVRQEGSREVRRTVDFYNLDGIIAVGYRVNSYQATKHGLPLPAYSKEGDSLVLTIYRNAKAATESLDHDVLDSLNSSERKGWEFMAGRIGTTQSEYARELGVTARTAQRHLTHFVELGLLRRMGSGPATEYLKP